MAATMRLVVEHADGQKITLSVTPGTIVAFERHFSVGLTALADGGRMEYVYWLAWESERRSGRIVKLFDEWIDDIASVEPEEEPSLPFQAPTQPS